MTRPTKISVVTGAAMDGVGASITRRLAFCSLRRRSFSSVTSRSIRAAMLSSLMPEILPPFCSASFRSSRISAGSSRW